MTSISLHDEPRWQDVIHEQTSAVGLALRKETITFLAVLGAIAALVIYKAIEFEPAPNRNMRMYYAPQAAILVMLVGLIVPFGVWRTEDLARRAYHWAMPVARVPHTLMKVLAGWLWLMAGVLVYLLWIAGLAWATSYLTGGTTRWVSAWQWIIPFTAATVAYVLASAAVVGSNHPWRWIGGGVIAFLVARLLFQILEMPDADRMLVSTLNGYYGLEAALFGKIDDSGPSVGRWLGATAIWSAIGAAALGIATYRREE